MADNDRLHALDAVRAWALLLGIVLHATMPFLAGTPAGFWVWSEAPSATLASIFWFIHIFRMPAFFLIAGLFARMVVERRGTGAFIRDRAKRIGVPLVLGLPIVLASLIAAAFGAAALVGIEPAALLGGSADQGTDPPEIPAGYFPWAHLWFLYYLLLFYGLALIVRAVVHALDKNETLRRALDRLVRFTFAGPWGAVVPGLPIGIYLYFFRDWFSWFGLPAPILLWPEVSSLVGYGIPFALGWLVHRQLALLLALGSRWQTLLICAVVPALGAYIIAGPTPNWSPEHVLGSERLIYIALYMLAQWCSILAFIALAVRFWSDVSPLRRYIADSSYWLYLFHMTTLAFIQVLIGELPWHWSVKYAISITFSIPVLLLSYHYLVRATFIGALLNGRRRVRESLFSLVKVS